MAHRLTACIMFAYIGASAHVLSETTSNSLRHAYGQLILHGAVLPIETFRATFGGFFPCGSFPIHFSDSNKFACNETLDGSFAGKYMLAHRGQCPFYEKAINAQKARARGVIIVNSEPGLLRVGTGNITLPTQILIPVAMIPRASWAVFEKGFALGATFTGSLKPVRDMCVNSTMRSMNWTERITHPTQEINTTISHIVDFGARIVQTYDHWPEEEVKEDGEACSAAYNVTYNGTFYDSTAAPAVKDIVQNVLQFNSNNSYYMPEGGLAEVANVELILPARAELSGFTDAEYHKLQTIVSETTKGPNSSVSTLPEAVAALFSGPMWSTAVELVLAQPILGCDDVTVNHAQYANKVVIVLRGGCSMINKTRFAQAAGAAGVIIVNEGIDVDALPSVGEAALDRPADLAALVKQHTAVQAISDAATDLGPIHIPAFMVSAHTAAKWFWRRPDGSIWSIAGPSQSERHGSLRIMLHPSRAKGDAWQNIEDLRLRDHKQAPTDGYHLSQWLLKYVQMHDPASPGGHASRIEALSKIMDSHGLGKAFQAIRESISSSESEVGALSGGVGRTRPFSAAHVWAPFVTQFMRLSSLDRKASMQVVSCAADTGSTFTIRLEDVEVSTAVSPVRKVQELLRQQACLEQMVLHNAGVLGTYLSMLRHETEPQDWSRVMMSMLHSYSWDRTQLNAFTDIFVAAAEEYALIQGDSAPESTIADYIRSPTNGM